MLPSKVHKESDRTERLNKKNIDNAIELLFF